MAYEQGQIRQSLLITEKKARWSWFSTFETSVSIKFGASCNELNNLMGNKIAKS